MEGKLVGVGRAGSGAARGPRFGSAAQRPGAAAGEDALGSLAAVADKLAFPLPVDRMAAVVADAAVKTLGAPALVIAVRDGFGPQLRAVHVSGLPEDVRHGLAAILSEAWSLLDRTARPGRPAVEPVASRDIEMLAAVPIPPSGPRLGVVLVGRAHDRRFSDDERAYLSVLSALFGFAARRRPLGGWPAGPDLRVGDMEIDVAEQRVVAGDRDARLTPSEIRLLLFLAAEPGRPRTRREILRHLWHTRHVGDERACDAHVSNLRRKIEGDPSRPERVVTIRGVGYALLTR